MKRRNKVKSQLQPATKKVHSFFSIIRQIAVLIIKKGGSASTQFRNNQGKFLNTIMSVVYKIDNIASSNCVQLSLPCTICRVILDGP